MNRVSVHSDHPHWFAELAEATRLGPFQRITEVEFYDQAVSPAGFATLANLKHLKRISITRGSVSPAAIEAFRKQRPDVDVGLDPCALRSPPAAFSALNRTPL